jgi:hypothetical protein
MDFLPEYMKFCYKALLDVYEEMEQEMVKEGRAFCVYYVKNEVNIITLQLFHRVTSF